MALVTKNDILELIPQLGDSSIYFQKIADELFAQFLSNGETTALELMLSKDIVKPTKEHFEKVITVGKCDIVKLLLRFAAPPNNALQIAMKCKQSEIIKLLLVDKRYDLNFSYGFSYKLIDELCKYGDVEILKMALTDERIDPSNNKNYPIQIAAKNGDIEIVKYLMADPRVNPGDDNNYALNWAVDYNKLEVVKLLLTDPRVDATMNDNKALSEAFRQKHMEIFEVLIPHSDLTKVTDKNILELVKKVVPQLPQNIWDAFTDLMKQYNVKSINIETGKQFSVEYNEA